MSMGFLIDNKSSVIWRGLMVMNAIDKLLYQVAWGPLDYLVVDTPPGTGDTHLSIVQNLPVAGVLLITTPQTTALEVTRRGANIFKHLNIPIIGIVENMSSVICPQCNNEIILYNDGTRMIAEELGIKVMKIINITLIYILIFLFFLGVQILQTFPLSELIMNSCNSGKPIILSAPKSIQTDMYKHLAEHVIFFLTKQPLNMK